MHAAPSTLSRSAPPANVPARDAAGGVCVVKVGGSLVSDRERLRAILAACVVDGPVAVVPGGGPFADAVRTSQAALGFDDALAHRLALDAMGRMAEIFCSLEPRLTATVRLEDLTQALREGRSIVWDPAALKVGFPEIPESWEITSDSLALWLASRLGASRCILEKSAPVIATDAAELAATGVVDAAFPRFAAAFAGEIVVRGPSTLGQAA